MSRVRAILWDADGVLQRLPAMDEVWPFLPEPQRTEALAETFGSDFHDVLTGRIDMGAHVEAVIESLGLQAHRDAILEVWNRFPPVEESRALVRLIREQGTLCVLATNQDTLRAPNMRVIYDSLMDRGYYSPEMGLAKPDPAYFLAIADDLGLEPSELLFIDDTLSNVEGARKAGVKAEHWHFERGIDALRSLLEAHGVVV